jgi:murein DD-endopeptidase MepM/ murein hydrolase activator NlpD
MANKISLLVVSHGEGTTRQLTVSKTLLTFVLLISIGGIATLAYMVHDYRNLCETAVSHRDLTRKLDAQHKVIQEQKKQIHEFATKIDAFKERLLALKGFENKIRAIAAIEEDQKDEGFFGVGGSIPEDLAPLSAVSEGKAELIREMHDQIAQLKVASLQQQSGFQFIMKKLDEQHNLLAHTPSIRPVKGWATSKFGHRKSPFTGRREFHKGYDIGARKGSSIVATADGVISFTGRKGSLGKTIVINHGHGYVTRYSHCDKFLKKRGDKVKRGDTIALVGNSGRSTGSHLHYEVHLNGLPVNPVKYFLN